MEAGQTGKVYATAFADTCLAGYSREEDKTVCIPTLPFHQRTDDGLDSPFKIVIDTMQTGQGGER